MISPRRTLSWTTGVRELRNDNFRVLSLLLGCTLMGCDGRASWREAPPLPVVEFESLFQRVDSIVLEQPPDYPLVVVSGFDVSATGEFLIVDGRDARIGIHSADGKLLLSIGRRGDGPGEFQYPVSPRFDAEGRIHVADRTHHRISVFDEGGELLRDFSTPPDFRIDGLELSSGGYVLSGLPPYGENSTVVRAFDWIGNLQWEALRVSSLVPEGQAESLRWQTIRRSSMTLAGDTAFVTHSLFDSLWAIDRGDPTVHRSQSVGVEGYASPVLPRVEVEGNAAIMEWVMQQMVPVAVEGDGVLLVIPFVKGVYTGETRTSAAMRDPNGRWLAVTQVPVVKAARGHRLYTIERPTLEDFVVGVYEWSQP
jgi:hypothetical protein